MKLDRMSILPGMILTGLLVGCVSRPETPTPAPMAQEVKVSTAPPGPQIILPVTVNPNDASQGWVLLNGTPLPVRQDAGSWKISDLSRFQGPPSPTPPASAAPTPAPTAPVPTAPSQPSQIQIQLTPAPTPATGQMSLTQAKVLLEIDKVQLERALLNRLNELSATITSVDELNAVLERMGVVIQQLNPPAPSP